MAIGKRLKELRIGANMTQDALAAAFELSRTAIINYEKDKRDPAPEMLCKIATYFHTTTDYLLGHADERFPSAVAEAREQYLIPTGNSREDTRRRQLLELLDQRGRTMNLDQLEAYVDALDKLMQLARKAAKDDEEDGKDR